ncbi:carbohydrate porin [Parabacteroides gordonii]|uniref:carbohydrate porin n=1 Tax=Parabacteroides gordonii TaxID=574930 RepID=UPI00241CA587|nr:carbohydrate porin [Parabacteroides gordonii]
MKLKTILFFMGCMMPTIAFTQTFSGTYTTEWQWNMKKKTNWVNLLRLDMILPLWKDGSLEAATIHVAKTNEYIIDDWQTFSNIEEENNYAAIALLGYMHTWEKVHLFVGVRNVNEDFFTSDVTSLFTNSSCGIFPTISASYPIANYPLSGLTVYFDVNFSGYTLKNSLYNGVGYNSWNRHDNPFLIRPKRDGVFNIAQLEYGYGNGSYFIGAAVHNRQYPVDEEGEMSPMVESLKKTSCAWWIYGEQLVWEVDDKNVSLMAQYSENTCRQNSCYRYAEIGCTYAGVNDQFGVSGLYAHFFQGKEWSLELTWNKTINESLFIQPIFQYVRNREGSFTVLSARVHYSF